MAVYFSIGGLVELLPAQATAVAVLGGLLRTGHGAPGDRPCGGAVAMPIDPSTVVLTIVARRRLSPRCALTEHDVYRTQVLGITVIRTFSVGCLGLRCRAVADGPLIRLARCARMPAAGRLVKTPPSR